jgi:hypothetical protein
MQNTIRKSAKPQEPWEVIHPLSPEDSVGMTALRSMVAGMKGKLEGTAAGGPFNSILERVAVPDGAPILAFAFKALRK